VLWLRKKRLCIRFRRRDLFQLDELANSLGLPSRSRLVNIALQNFLDSSAEKNLILGRKRPVKIMVDSALKPRLDELARKLRVPKAELVKIALKEFAEHTG
jgi:metal-responsive CopG/Arc/MetJ family transcriptional regulator